MSPVARLSGADSHLPLCERTASYDSCTGTLAAAAACAVCGVNSILIDFVVIVVGLRRDIPLVFGDRHCLRHDFPRPPKCEICIYTKMSHQEGRRAHSTLYALLPVRRRGFAGVSGRLDVDH